MKNQEVSKKFGYSSDLVNNSEYRIFGPPGTGKTTTLTRLITEACKEYGSERVLAASFTKTAARTLVARHLPMNDEQIGTLHALAYRQLDRPKVVTRTHLKDWNEAHPSCPFEGGGTPDLDDPYGDVDMSGKQDGDRLLEELNRLRGLRIAEEAWPMRVQNFALLWSQFKQDLHLIDFTDMIERCLTEQIPIPHEAAVLFLDEVQDFSPLELALARQWGNQCEKVYLAGDDEQCLYSFKGATPDAFLYPELPQDRITILEQSYRVPRLIHAAAVSWAEGIEKRMPKSYRPRPYDGLVDQLPITYKYLDPLLGDLEEWMNAGKTIALLASCSFFIDPLKHKLREWGVPFHNPYRKTRGDWNPLTGRSGTMSAADRVRLFRKVADTGQWWTYADLWAWAGCLEADSVFRHGAKTEMRRKAEDEQTMHLSAETSDLDRWFTGDGIADAATSGDTAWFYRHLLKSYDKPIGYACRILEERGPETLQKSPQVLIGTMHSVKGGEADIVVLFPDLSPAGYREWTSPGDGEDSIRRMFYVGMTRARESLYWAQPNGPCIAGYV